jgi:hypothetical protein
VQFLAGEVQRDCARPRVLLQTFQDKEFKGQEDPQDGRELLEIITSYCNDVDLCNGSGRLAEISIMKILVPATIVLIISFFSRL